MAEDANKIPEAKPNDGLLDKRTVAGLLRKNPKTIDRWMHDGVIPYIKLGKGRRATVLFNWDSPGLNLRCR